MSGIKDQFNNMRKNMPKASMWLLLTAAFVVVLILLTLLLTRDTKQTDNSTEVAQPITVNATPDIVDFSDTNVESPNTPENIVVSASAPVKITNVEYDNTIDGLNIKDTCTPRTSIDSETTCKITIEYKPKSAKQNTDMVANIVWRDVNDAENMTNKTPINIKLGAIIPVKKITTPEPVKVEPVYEEEIEEEYIEPEPVKKAVEQIAPPMQIFEPEPEPSIPSEACSDFALAGYGLSGTQTGWIKPEKGTYYFHPFSDVNCDSPTGIYNPDNGIITDIDDSGKKIGTDAEHIGYSIVGSGTLPNLRSRPNTTTTPATERIFGGMSNLKKTFSTDGLQLIPNDFDKKKYKGSAENTESVISSMPYDRTFILRQFKPIPATIVSEVRADPSTYNCTADGECTGGGVPVRATVDRNVYSDNGRTIILPAGTLLLGYLTGELPGPYKAIGRMKINWYQFIRPDGVEFNFASSNQDPYSADAQGRVGVPGHGSTDYVEQIVMPLLTAIVPAAVNMIAPIADSFVNQIDLDNNTVVQSGKVRSSELAKQEVISAWNQVAQKLLVDALNNTVPPFSIAAGTRITVYSPVDLIVTCGKDEGTNCNVAEYPKDSHRRKWNDVIKNSELNVKYGDESWIGQARSFNLSGCCKDGKPDEQSSNPNCKQYDYRTLAFYCQSNQYQAINNAKQEALYQNQQDTGYEVAYTNNDGSFNTKKYNEEVLGLTYTGAKIDNPFTSSSADTGAAANVITCEGGSLPDANGCCPGETFTEMGPDAEYPYACCPAGGGDCFPPIN